MKDSPCDKLETPWGVGGGCTPPPICAPPAGCLPLSLPGGTVTFDISNDAPTMTGARATFAIALRFPGTQMVLPDGRVVWSQNCTVNGTRVRQGDAVFPEELGEGPGGIFPDGQSFPPSTHGKRRKFVYVWQTWEGIESVEIIQVVPLAPAAGENTVELTVTCQGSLPDEVCTTVLDPMCLTPQQSVCSPVPPAPACQLLLRQAFNQSGVYCLNVSLANPASLAVASTQVSIQGRAWILGGGAPPPGLLSSSWLDMTPTPISLPLDRRVKYRPLPAGPTRSPLPRAWLPDRATLRLLLRQAWGTAPTGESSPLLSGNVV
uniref:Premelanosome protein n=1 Tax=Chelonoidis abingdonii TaxID=106734 RepID=A0A8C0GKC7_CHEAB